MTATSTPSSLPTVVFFGTGPVAAASLQLLIEHFTIEAVITKPTPPHHNAKAPVLTVATKHNLPVLLAADRLELNELIVQRSFTSQLAILIDYGIIVSQAVIDSFPLGIVNSHFSLLPQWRGADPLTFAVLSGQPITGVSLMLLVQKMDEGPLLAQASYAMPPRITTPQLTRDLIELSAKLLQRTVPDYLVGSILPHPQVVTGAGSESLITYSRKLTKADGQLDPDTKSALTLEREIRAFLGWPGSSITMFGRSVIITEAAADMPDGKPTSPAHEKPGEITITPDKKAILIATTSGSLCVTRLKPIGKKDMSAADFLRGCRL